MQKKQWLRRSSLKRRRRRMEKRVREALTDLRVELLAVMHEWKQRSGIIACIPIAGRQVWAPWEPHQATLASSQDLDCYYFVDTS